jgi:hypothetical protein
MEPAAAWCVSVTIIHIRTLAIRKREATVMLTRRGFTSCAICAVTGFIATDASAQGAPPAANGITRKILSQMDGPAPGYVTINMEVEVAAGATIGRHTHPGIESGYILEGGVELPIEGHPTLMLKQGDGFHRSEPPMRAASQSTRRPGSRSPMWWRRASRSRRRPDRRASDLGFRSDRREAVVCFAPRNPYRIKTPPPPPASVPGPPGATADGRRP